MSFVVGCDVGTQSSKGVLVSSQGEVMANASAEHGFDVPASGWAEQDPQQWLEALTEVIGRLTHGAPGEITHVAVAAQVDGVVAADDHHVPLHPALIWMDRRATSEAETMAKEVGEDRLFAITGLNADASHGAPKMLWLRERLGADPRWYLPPQSVITAWLCGEIAQDEANASSTMLFDVTARQWSDEVLEATGIDRRHLPQPLNSTQSMGTLRPERAKLLGLSSNTQVVVGTGDDHAAAVGAGAVRPGVVADVTGTAEPIGSASSTPVFDEQRLLETHAHAVPGLWFIENPGFVSGGSVRWLAGVLGIDQAEVLQLAGASPPGSRGLVFIPALSGAMAPRWNDRMRGSFTGLSLEHEAADLCRAVLEGCAFALRDNLDRLEALGLPIDRVHVTGGGASSPVWMQVKADVTGRVLFAVEGEGTAFGAACLAATAAGWFPDVAAASEAMVTLTPESWEPDQATADTYEDAYRRYRATFDSLEKLDRR